MGLVNSALQIGLSALQTYQSTLQAIGANVSNAGNPDYTRQIAGLSSVHGSPMPEGFQPGAGVALTELKRNIDEALENRLRAAIGDSETSTALQESLGRVESFFDEASGAGISSRLTEFFNSFSDVQNDPSNLGLREIALATGDGLASALTRLRTDLLNLGEDIDDQIRTLVADADRLADQIAELNAEVTAAEGGAPSAAHALRDQRDALLRDLSQLFDVAVREQPDGSINVYIGSEPLIQGGVSRGLTSVSEADGFVVRTSILFADGERGGSPVRIRGGRFLGLITARDRDAYGRVADVDQLAAAIISEVNRVHADGQGLAGFDRVTGSYSVSDTIAALNSTDSGLVFPPKNGSFFIAVQDRAGGPVTAYQINVDLDGVGPDTTLDSLVADINATVEGVTASVAPGGRLDLLADDGLRFSFGHDGARFREDTSGVLAALGVNTFFDGIGAADIRVNDVLHASSGLLAAATVSFSGDGTNAGRLAEVALTSSDLLGGVTLVEGYGRVATEVAVAGGHALDDAESNQAVLSSLRAQRENISGVSLDEEAINLVKFERAFQGAARYVSVVDRLMREMMNLVR